MRAIAESNLKKLFFALLFFAGVIGAASFYPQFAQGYEIKTACRLTCNDLINVTRFGQAPGAKPPTDDFINKARRAGVKLTDRQYSFKLEERRQDAAWACKARVEYPVVVQWAFIGDIFTEIPPFKMKKVVAVEHKVSNNY